MKKNDTPHKDPNLKKLLSNLEVPEIPKNFSQSVMESVKELRVQNSSFEFKVPYGIKIGIPVFLIICLVIILIFPGNQQDPVSIFINNFSNSSFLSFFDKISKSIQLFQFPQVAISNEAVYYTLGGIGLVWMYILFESFSKRFIG